MVVDLPAALPPSSPTTSPCPRLQADAFQNTDRPVIGDDPCSCSNALKTPPNPPGGLPPNFIFGACKSGEPRSYNRFLGFRVLLPYISCSNVNC